MENKTPKVSVLIPSFNYAQYLPEAIDSVLAQSYTDFELIIVDNCSTDNTVDVVNTYVEKDSRIKLHINETNIGMYRNYNQALLLAKGEYIKFLNADDKFHPKLLEKFVYIFQNHPSVSLVTSYRQYFGDKSDILKPSLNGLINGKEAILNVLETFNWIGEPTTVMFKRENLTLGLFDTSLLMFADLDMWLRQMQVGDIYVIDTVLSFFRIHEGQGTVYLNDQQDKKEFSYLQLHEYTRYALQINRYGYNFHADFPKEVNLLMQQIAKRSMKSRHYASMKKLHSTKVRYLIHAMYISYIQYKIKRILTKIKKIFNV